MTIFRKLESLCEKVTDGSHFSPKSLANGFPMLSVKDMTDSGFDYSSCNHISETDYEILKKNDCVPQKNDVLIAKDGSYLKHVFVVEENKEQAILSSIGILRPNLKEIDPYYLKYYLSTEYVKKQVAKKYVSGSALPRIILKNFKDIDIPYVDLETQQKKVKILKLIDKKIENNKLISKLLEETAKTIYDYWFLQFDFPNEEGKPYKSSGGKMVYSEELKREIPEKWALTSLEKVIRIVLGGTPKTKKEEYWNGAINWLNSGEVVQFPVVTTEKKITQVGVENSATELMKKGTVIVSITGNIRASYLAIDSCANQSVVGLCETKNLKKSFLYPMMKDSVDYYLKISTGNCQQHINKKAIEDTLFPLPNENVLKKYYDICEPIFEQITNCALENVELSSLRDWLLPMLMNGQITFKEEDPEK